MSNPSSTEAKCKKVQNWFWVFRHRNPECQSEVYENQQTCLFPVLGPEQCHLWLQWNPACLSLHPLTSEPDSRWSLAPSVPTTVPMGASSNRASVRIRRFPCTCDMQTQRGRSDRLVPVVFTEPQHSPIIDLFSMLHNQRCCFWTFLSANYSDSFMSFTGKSGEEYE